MKLKSMQVKNFKCAEDSTQFDICPVTCLVGKNEAGKTSLLEALHKLNSDVAELGEFDILLEYPRRRRKEYERRASDKPDDALITRWELEDKDVKAIVDQLGAGAIKSNIVEIRKGYYPGQRWVSVNDETSERISMPASVQAKLEKQSRDISSGILMERPSQKLYQSWYQNALRICLLLFFWP